MGACCTSNTKQGHPRTATCPVNGKTYKSVDKKTLLHHLNKPWQLELPDQGYYFCDSKDCEVIYFGEDTTVFTQVDIRTPVDQKSDNMFRTVCYCFGVRQVDLETQETPREFIIEQTRNGSCDCEIRNPSGRCCLKDIPKESP